jgi:hypothetical protein
MNSPREQYKDLFPPVHSSKVNPNSMPSYFVTTLFLASLVLQVCYFILHVPALIQRVIFTYKHTHLSSRKVRALRSMTPIVRTQWTCKSPVLIIAAVTLYLAPCSDPGTVCVESSATAFNLVAHPKDSSKPIPIKVIEVLTVPKVGYYIFSVRRFELHSQVPEGRCNHPRDAKPAPLSGSTLISKTGRSALSDQPIPSRKLFRIQS